MAADHAEAVQKALELKKAGNEIVALVGGREIHPVNVRLGGFYRVPSRKELRPLRGAAEARARPLARDRGVRGRPRLPGLRAATTSSSRCATPRVPALRRPDRLEPRARHRRSRSTRSTSSRSTSRTRTRCTRCARARVPTSSGPLARYSLNHDRLPAVAQDAARAAGLGAAVPEPVPEHRRARGRAGVRVRRGARASSTATSRPSRPFVEVAPRDGHRPRRDRGAARAALPPLRDRRGRPGTRRRRSSRRPRRTRRRSRTTCWHFVPTRARPAEGRAHAGAASRRSATTTRASRARRTS